ncbi:hypothetical protein AB4254_13720, partial [Vibrio breoganii]
FRLFLVKTQHPESVLAAGKAVQDNPDLPTASKIPTEHSTVIYNKHKAIHAQDRIILAQSAIIPDEYRHSVTTTNHEWDTWGEDGLLKLLNLKATIECAIDSFELTTPGIVEKAKAQIPDNTVSYIADTVGSISKYINQIKEDKQVAPTYTTVNAVRRCLQNIASSLPEHSDAIPKLKKAIKATEGILLSEKKNPTTGIDAYYDHVERFQTINIIKNYIAKTLVKGEAPTKTEKGTEPSL